MQYLMFFLQQDNGTNGEELCGSLGPILRIVGLVILGIKVVVPILLIIFGMLDLGKAVAEKDEGKIKEAQNRLIKRAIAAVIVFLVATLVSILMGLVGNSDYKTCMNCINHPFDKNACAEREPEV